ncbi:hypothetical protein [Cryobacterium glaciale]|uniref:hypothetical protein n=1 Tax=Cryobacterium glaciale TaxID=1259145 RepID=UPI00141BE820|nr:hypothetical protein [Cryobacterium glaciale]
MSSTARTNARRPLLSNFVCKTVMAVTGLIFSAFVLVHMFGNLKVFLGAGHFNDYAQWLREAFEPVLPYEGLLWVLRLALLASLAGHVTCAALLWRRARCERGLRSGDGRHEPRLRKSHGELSTPAGRPFLRPRHDRAWPARGPRALGRSH